MKLNVATAQFSVSPRIEDNATMLHDQLVEASKLGAHVAHFAECALSGYAGVDFESWDDFDWPALDRAHAMVCEQAKRLKLWVVFGSSHQLSADHKPHNSVYVVNDEGKLADRYDKRFCASMEGSSDGELAYFSPGNRPCVFDIKGIKCGIAICHEYRYPELYREYTRLGVRLVFHSFHAGGIDPSIYDQMQAQVGRARGLLQQGSTLPEATMPATMRSYAGNNHLWISCPNSSAPESCWPAFFVRPDGIISGALTRNVDNVLLSELDTDQPFYDSTALWRERAMSGVLHSGALVEDPRSDDRQSF